MLKAVIFDIDGVLIDSKEANAEFYALLLERAGHERPSREAVDKYFHLPMRGVIENLTGLHDKAEIERIWKMGHDPSVYPTHLVVFPASLENVLEELCKRYRLAIVTSRVKMGVELLYGVKDIAHFFDSAVAYEDYANPKPHPEPLQVALKRLGVQPKEAVYIGDSHVDVEAANAAGIWSIHLATEKHKDATAGIASFDEIPAAVEAIAKKTKRPR